MCQLSNEVLHNLIKQNIIKYNGEPKLIDEWGLLINEVLPKSRRMTTKELANVFVVFRKRGDFDVEHSGRSYAFRVSL